MSTVNWRQAMFTAQGGGIYRDITDWQKIVVIALPIHNSIEPYGIFLAKTNNPPVLKEACKGKWSVESTLDEYTFNDKKWYTCLPPWIEPYLGEMRREVLKDLGLLNPEPPGKTHLSLVVINEEDTVEGTLSLPQHCQSKGE